MYLELRTISKELVGFLTRNYLKVAFLLDFFFVDLVKTFLGEALRQTSTHLRNTQAIPYVSIGDEQKGFDSVEQKYAADVFPTDNIEKIHFLR